MTKQVGMTKQFKVVAVSTRTNSFGLYGMVLVAKDGEAWEVGANSINVKKKGDIITVPVRHSWAEFQFEIPNRLEDAPEPVIQEVWSLT